MSLKAVADFWKKVDDDKKVQEEFFKEVPKDLTNGAPIVTFAGRHGFQFTEPELQQAAAAVAGKSELSEAQLGAVAGGASQGFFNAGPTSGRILRSFAGLGSRIGKVAV